MLFVRSGRSPVTIAGLYASLGQNFFGQKKCQRHRLFVYNFAVEMLSRCTGTAGRESFQPPPVWLIAASCQGRGNLLSRASKCRRCCFKAFPPRSFASKLCPHSGPATASHRPSNRLCPATQPSCRQTAPALFSPAGLYPIPPTHARDPARPVFLPSAHSARHNLRTCARASACTAPLVSVDPDPRHGVKGPALSEGAAVTTLIKYTPWNLT